MMTRVFLKYGLWLFLAAALALIPVFPQVPRLAYTYTPSLPYTVFIEWRRFPEKDIAQGSYVKFVLSHPLLFQGKETVVFKRISCDEGHLLRVSWPNYYCDGLLLGEAKAKSLKGEPAPRFEFNGVVPPGRAFVTASHKDSFDSRYWGFLDKRKIQSLLTPIF
jgi:conjugal transfer pilin signal peptidase TrbI